MIELTCSLPRYCFVQRPVSGVWNLNMTSIKLPKEILHDDADCDGAETVDALYETAYQYSPYASVVVDWNGQILACNRRAVQTWWKIAQDQSETIVGTNICDVISLDVEEVQKRIRSGLRSGTVELPMMNVPRPRSRPNIALRASLLPATVSSEHRILLSQDVLIATAQAIAKINQQKEKARKAAAWFSSKSALLEESLNGARIFTNAVSHDLRGPLGSLNKLLSMFDAKYSDDLPDNGQYYIQLMREAAQNLQDLTLCLLDHASATSGQIAVRNVSLNQLLFEVRDALTEQITEAGGTLHISAPQANILAEPLLLRNLVVNLILNSVKYRSANRPLHIYAEVNFLLPDLIELMIRDNGEGFPPDKAKTIFQPFERLNSEKPGSGIGLATCAEICKRHGWDISAEASKDAGACFRVLIPLNSNPSPFPATL